MFEQRNYKDATVVKFRLDREEAPKILAEWICGWLDTPKRMSGISRYSNPDTNPVLDFFRYFGNQTRAGEEYWCRYATNLLFTLRQSLEQAGMPPGTNRNQVESNVPPDFIFLTHQFNRFSNLCLQLSSIVKDTLPSLHEALQTFSYQPSFSRIFLLVGEVSILKANQQTSYIWEEYWNQIFCYVISVKWARRKNNYAYIKQDSILLRDLFVRGDPDRMYSETKSPETQNLLSLVRRLFFAKFLEGRSPSNDHLEKLADLLKMKAASVLKEVNEAKDLDFSTDARELEKIYLEYKRYSEQPESFFELVCAEILRED